LYAQIGELPDLGIALKPSAKIEKVIEGKLPTGEQVGSEDVMARVCCFDKVLRPVEPPHPALRATLAPKAEHAPHLRLDTGGIEFWKVLNPEGVFIE
jgi:hypothetical protein